MQKMVQFAFTLHDILDSFLTEEGRRAILESNGFDLSKEITQHIDPANGNYVYSQILENE